MKTTPAMTESILSITKWTTAVSATLALLGAIYMATGWLLFQLFVMVVKW